jgi:hypothetical protein
VLHPALGPEVDIDHGGVCRGRGSDGLCGHEARNPNTAQERHAIVTRFRSQGLDGS